MPPYAVAGKGVFATLAEAMNVANAAAAPKRSRKKTEPEPEPQAEPESEPEAAEGGETT